MKVELLLIHTEEFREESNERSIVKSLSVTQKEVTPAQNQAGKDVQVLDKTVFEITHTFLVITDFWRILTLGIEVVH